MTGGPRNRCGMEVWEKNQNDKSWYLALPSTHQALLTGCEIFRRDRWPRWLRRSKATIGADCLVWLLVQNGILYTWHCAILTRMHAFVLYWVPLFTCPSDNLVSFHLTISLIHDKIGLKLISIANKDSNMYEVQHCKAWRCQGPMDRRTSAIWRAFIIVVSGEGRWCP